MKTVKSPYCIYDPYLSFESAEGGLRFYLPAERGYVNYNLVHTVKSERNADIWRLSRAYLFDGEEIPITSMAAEWDMAIMIKGRCDFIGGYAHGDERQTSAVFKIDGRAADVTALTEPTPFSRVTVSVDSIGYDPDDGVSAALIHRKEYTVTKEGVTLRQSVEWLSDYTVARSYLAMMPPIKAMTDMLFTDREPTPRKIVCGTSISDVRSATLFGTESGIFFTMSVPEYPNPSGENLFSVSDNGTDAYNKMYFAICETAKVRRCDVWHSETEYRIGAKSNKQA